MTSVHEKLVGYVAGKMQKLGFEIKYMEGNHKDVVIRKPELPPKIINHRPDIYALTSTGAVGIGEAKTKIDLKTGRTRIQFLDFKNVVRENPNNRLFICVPLKAKNDLYQVLYNLGITLDTQIDIMLIPEELLPSHD